MELYFFFINQHLHLVFNQDFNLITFFSSEHFRKKLKNLNIMNSIMRDIIT